jgi:hypothetical protein
MSVNIVRTAEAILWSFLEIGIISVFVTGEKCLTVRSYRLSVLVQWKIEDVPVREEATHPSSISKIRDDTLFEGVLNDFAVPNYYLLCWAVWYR